MDYSSIGGFLDKFKKFLFKEEALYKTIAEIITKHIAYPIEIHAIKTKGKVIYIKGSPIVRNEVLIHKEGILDDLNALTEKKFNNIN